jgi:hypothetical protein
VQETRRPTIHRNAKSEVSRNKPTNYGTCAGPVPKYTARCQSSKTPEITGGPEYGRARRCVLCMEFRRSDRSGVSEFRGTVVTLLHKGGQVKAACFELAAMRLDSLRFLMG